MLSNFSTIAFSLCSLHHRWKFLICMYLNSYVYYLTTSAFWECSVKHSKWDYFFPSNLLTYEEFFVVSPLRFWVSQATVLENQRFIWTDLVLNTHIWKSVEKCLNLRRWIFSLGLVGCQNTKDVHLTKGCHELKTPKLEWEKNLSSFHQ